MLRGQSHTARKVMSPCVHSLVLALFLRCCKPFGSDTAQRRNHSTSEQKCAQKRVCPTTERQMATFEDRAGTVTGRLKRQISSMIETGALSPRRLIFLMMRV